MSTPEPPTTPPAAPTPVYVVNASGANGPAIASLVLGIVGFVLMPIPFFIGWFVGGIPDIIAVILGIVALNNDAARRHVGKSMAVVGIVLGGVSLLSVFIGAGSVW